jgi:glutathione S-transferase
MPDGAAMLALYHFGPVANSLTPLLCLLEKGLSFNHRLLDSRKWEHHSPEFQRLSPDGMVPLLLHDDRVVRESTVINEYLEDAFPDLPLRPADPWLRAEMRVWTKYVDEHFCPALTVLGAHGAASFAGTIDKAEMDRRLAAMPNADVRRKWERVSSGGYGEAELADARARLVRAAQRAETAFVDGREWLVGKEYSLADIKWYSMAPGLPRLAPDLCNPEATPFTMQWLERMARRPAVQQLADFRRPD